MVNLNSCRRSLSALHKQAYLGRGNFSCGIASIRMPWGHLCKVFLKLLIDEGGAGPLWQYDPWVVELGQKAAFLHDFCFERLPCLPLVTDFKVFFPSVCLWLMFLHSSREASYGSSRRRVSSWDSGGCPSLKCLTTENSYMLPWVFCK